jgi:hypothetical protein
LFVALSAHVEHQAALHLRGLAEVFWVGPGISGKPHLTGNFGDILLDNLAKNRHTGENRCPAIQQLSKSTMIPDFAGMTGYRDFWLFGSSFYLIPKKRHKISW